MFRRLLSFVRRWTGTYPVTDHVEGATLEAPDAPLRVGESHVRMPDGTWVHGAPRSGGAG